MAFCAGKRNEYLAARTRSKTERLTSRLCLGAFGSGKHASSYSRSLHRRGETATLQLFSLLFGLAILRRSC